MPLEGPFIELMHADRAARRRRRALLTANDTPQPAAPALAATRPVPRRQLQDEASDGDDDPNDGFPTEFDRDVFERATEIHRVQQAHLRETGWLGDFEPMLMSCPLTARKVSPEAVSEFAAIAWRCDGLGFAWECLMGPAAAAALEASSERFAPSEESARTDLPAATGSSERSAPSEELAPPDTPEASAPSAV